MGILENGLLGGFRNKVGPVIGRKSRGMDVIVSLYRTGAKAETEGEIRQQGRFKLLNNFLTQLSAEVEEGFRQYAKKKSAQNAAHSYNYGRAFIEDEHGIKLNFSKLVYSRGSVAIASCPEVSLTAPRLLTFKWMAEAESQYNRENDRASFVVWMEGMESPMGMLRVAQRSDLQISMKLPDNLSAQTLHCYMNFENDNGKLVGNSICVGAVEIG
jgi:hypothetical protein